MDEALKTYNIQLPVFSKIGGLLASEISIDEAALHAAILAINKAIENRDSADLLQKMNNAGLARQKLFIRLLTASFRSCGH